MTSQLALRKNKLLHHKQLQAPMLDNQVPPVNEVAPDSNANIQLNNAQVVQSANGGLAFQIDQANITTNEFVKQINEMKSANNWEERFANHNFVSALRACTNT